MDSMELSVEFLIMHFTGVAIYPFYLAYWSFSSPLWMGIWLIIAVVILYLVNKNYSYVWRNLFIAIWIFPGTIICGSATVVPWPLAVLSFFSGTGCSPIWALISSFAFNIIVVHLVFQCWTIFRTKRSSKNA